MRRQYDALREEIAQQRKAIQIRAEAIIERDREILALRKAVERTERCGECRNCRSVERVRAHMIALANPPHSHADDDTAQVWNDTLTRYPCENPK